VIVVGLDGVFGRTRSRWLTWPAAPTWSSRSARTTGRPRLAWTGTRCRSRPAAGLGHQGHAVHADYHLADRPRDGAPDHRSGCDRPATFRRSAGQRL